MPDTETIFSWIEDLKAFIGRGKQTVDDRRSVDRLLAAFGAFGLGDVRV